MTLGVVKLKRRIADLEAFDPGIIQKRWGPEVESIQTAIEETLASVFGHGTVQYNRYAEAARLDNGPVTMRLGPSFGRGSHDDGSEARQYVTEGKQLSISLLQQAVRGLEEEIGDSAPEAAKQHKITPQSSPSKVFVVHGHDIGAHQAMARFLEKIELEAIILQEQPNQGFTIIDKFEFYANQVGFAVVLLTPDDVGGSVLEPAQASRARQNVIFELGYFAGKLGRGRTCLLRKGEVEIPSDLYGVIYTDFDSAEGWKIKLIKELKAAGLEFDANKAWS